MRRFSSLLEPCLFSWLACHPSSFVRYPECSCFPETKRKKGKGKKQAETSSSRTTKTTTSKRKRLNNHPRTPMPQMLKLLSGQLVNRATTNTTASTARIPQFFRTAVPVDVGAADAGPEGEVGDTVIRGEEKGLCELFFVLLFSPRIFCGGDEGGWISRFLFLGAR